MLTPGTYTTSGGLMAKVYAVLWSQAHGCHIAVGALFTSRGTFLSAEFWRASDGRFHIVHDRPGPNDIDASFRALAEMKGAAA